MELTALIFLVAVANCAMTAVMLTKLCCKSEEQRTEEAVEAAMQRDKIDEGFENIMNYSVCGKTGMEER